jgi:hypothetical protein
MKSLEESKSDKLHKEYIDHTRKKPRSFGFFRLKYKSPYHDFKTGFFCKVFLFLGVFFLLLVLIQAGFSSIDFGENIFGMSIAFVILFFGIGLLLYFISCQFAKLAEIAKEIENEELLENQSSL